MTPILKDAWLLAGPNDTFAFVRGLLREAEARSAVDAVDGTHPAAVAVTVGLDIAKNVFRAHGVDAEGAVTFRKRLTRAKVVEFFAGLQPCLVGRVCREE